MVMVGLIFGWSPPFCFSEDTASETASIQSAEVTTGENGEKLISMDFQDVPLKQILKIFSQQAGMNFVASENIQDKKVTLFMDRVSVEDALNTILSANGFIFEKQPGANIFIVKNAGKSAVTVITKIYKLSYATVSGAGVGEGQAGEGIERVIQNILTSNGKMIVDSRTNSLLITDIPSNFASIEEVLKELDIKTQQVMISAEIMEVSLDTLKRIGVEWGTATGQLMSYAAGTRSTFWPFKRGLFKDAAIENTAGSVSFTNLSAVVQAIKTDVNTQHLARPRLLTLNNRTAEMKITKNAAVSTTTVTISQGGSPQTTTSLERYEVGTTLKVTPHINKDDYITLTIEPEVSRVTESAFGSGNYDPLKRTSKTSIMVKDGETIVIAGLIEREDTDSNRKVPILGEVPFLGKIFDRDSKTRSDTEVLVFITTQVIKEDGSALETAMRQEFDYAGANIGQRENGILPQSPVEVKRKTTRQARREMSEFHKLAREQDSPLSGKELMVEAEVLRLKSRAPVVAQ